ncbi:MAG: WG repeat-containing protein, partial [Lachnospiraceae bacterium]|nr:WG repeat-containing protein [Lachnospiraceae bacterium]
MKNGKWGFIDVNGNMVFEYQYDNARSFCRGFAAVEINGLWTLIDLDGKQIMEPRFKGMYEMSSSGTVPVLEDNGWNILSFYSMS